MAPRDTNMPEHWRPLPAQMDEIGAVIRWYVSQDPGWTSESVAALQVSLEHEFETTPVPRPLTSALIHPQTLLAHAQDHLVAAAAALRAPDTVLAMMTIFRTVLIAAGRAFYLASPSIDVRERVRRGLNVQLGTDTEMMSFLGRDSPDFPRLDTRRRQIIKAGRTLGYSVRCPEPQKSQTYFPAWHLGAKPLGDMDAIALVLGVSGDPKIGNSVFRILSASAHAQQHSLLPFMQQASAESRPDGNSVVPIGLSGESLILWLCVVGVALDAAVGRCCELFGWDEIRWNSSARPHIAAWRAELAAVSSQPQQRMQIKAGPSAPPTIEQG